jgi:hypothetical protein
MLLVSMIAFQCTSVAIAGTLSIKAQATVNVERDRLHVTAIAMNHGDEAAYNVKTNIMLLGEQLEGPVSGLLGVKQSATFRIEKILSGIKQGRYPLTVIVDFHDANQYPFSALVGTTFHYKQDVAPDLLAQARDLIMEKDGKLRLEVRNPASGEKRVQATVVLPRELFAPRPEVDFQIEPGGEQAVFFEILNASALPGATYPVFCYLEYDLQETHYTTLATGMVRIAKQENWLQRSLWLWIGLAVFLGVAIIVYQFRGK